MLLILIFNTQLHGHILLQVVRRLAYSLRSARNPSLDGNAVEVDDVVVAGGVVVVGAGVVSGNVVAMDAGAVLLEVFQHES